MEPFLAVIQWAAQDTSRHADTSVLAVKLLQQLYEVSNCCEADVISYEIYVYLCDNRALVFAPDELNTMAYISFLYVQCFHRK